MEELKALEELTSPDARLQGWMIEDPEADRGIRPMRLEDIYSQISAVSLSAAVPEPVRSAFNTARNLWLYGWFHYPLFTAASLHGYVALEMALYEKWEAENPADNSRMTLRPLLEYALENGWISDEGLAYAEEARERRRIAKEMVPEKLRTQLQPDPLSEDPLGYTKILVETLPKLRNAAAHRHYFMFPHHGRRDLERVADLLNRVFGPHEEPRASG